jgi:hypothetical protein
MFKNTTFTLAFALCATFAQAQNLNEFNDVRSLGVLLNPAHIGKEDAKGELSLNYQLTGGPNLGKPNEEDKIARPQEVSLAYTHHLKIKTGVLNLGLVGGTRQNNIYGGNNTSGGIAASYTQNLGEKDAISGGISAVVMRNDMNYYSIFFHSENNAQFIECGNDFIYGQYAKTNVNSNVFATVNTGLEYKHRFSPNNFIQGGFVVQNINTPNMVFDVDNALGETITKTINIEKNYIAQLSAEFMLSKTFGFAPMILYKTNQLQSEKYAVSETRIYGLEMIFKNKQNNEWRVGGILNFKEINKRPAYGTNMFSVRYQTPKFNIGISSNAYDLASYWSYVGQLSAGYAF